MMLVMGVVGGLVAWSLFGSSAAKRRAEHSGMENAMIMLAMLAFGALFAILF